MGDTMTLPAIGTVKRQYVYMGGALVVGIVGYAYWKRASAPAEELPAGSGEGVDDGTEWPYRPGGNSVVPSDPVDPSSLPPATNDEWARRAQTAMVEAGWESGEVATALGRFMSRLSLDTKQEQMIRAALALIGPPPRDPPDVILQPAAPTTPSSGSGSGGQGTVTRWEPHHVAAGTLTQIAARYAAIPGNKTSVESTRRSIILHNPSIAGRTSLGPSILYVPIRK